MDPADIPAGLRLSRQANWNQTAEDWQRLLAWEPAGCFVLDIAGQVAGTVTTTGYGTDLAWIGMLLVDAACRQRGFGRQLLLHAMAHPKARGIATLMLDATPLGRPLYEHLGFQEQFALDRWQGIAPANVAPMAVVPLPPGMPSPAIVALDRRAFGVERRRLLADLQAAPAVRTFQSGADDETSGFGYLRPGDQRWHIGPLVARDSASATSLLQAALGAVEGQMVEVDVPRFPGAQQVMRRAGLAPVRPFIRMARGEPAPTADPTLIYATAAPEIG
jgi:GNAT superfamily N-acetyltransferase